jgi:preprotein translocase subunit YajC
MLVSPAFAQAAGSAGGIAGGIESFLPLVLIFVVFYFLMIRPQQKKMKAHKELMGQLRRGDRVLTSGGIIGTINKVVDEKEVVVEIAEGVRVRVLRGTIQDIISKTEPVAGEVEKPADK